MDSTIKQLKTPFSVDREEALHAIASSKLELAQSAGSEIMDVVYHLIYKSGFPNLEQSDIQLIYHSIVGACLRQLGIEYITHEFADTVTNAIEEHLKETTNENEKE